MLLRTLRLEETSHYVDLSLSLGGLFAILGVSRVVSRSDTLSSAAGTVLLVNGKSLLHFIRQQT